jgi:adenylate kinase
MSQKTTVGNTIAEYMKAGNLVPEEIAVNITCSRLSDIDSSEGFILDGYPRTIYQAEALEKAGTTVDVVFLLDVSSDVIVDRMSGRRCCPECGATYHTRCHPSVMGNNCEICNVRLIQRADDNPLTVMNRLDIYHEKTAPLIDFYNERGILYRIAGEQDSESIFSGICALLKFDNP